MYFIVECLLFVAIFVERDKIMGQLEIAALAYEMEYYLRKYN
jgi:hypothetical protein